MPRTSSRKSAKLTPSYAGITYDRIDRGTSLALPHRRSPRNTYPSHRAIHLGERGFSWHRLDPAGRAADDEYPLYLTTGRVLYHYHTGTMTMKSEGLNECAPECFVEISAKDAEQFGIEDGALVEIASRRGKISARIAVSDKAVTGTVFIPFHFARAAANKLTNAKLDPISGIPEFKVCAVRLSKAA